MKETLHYSNLHVCLHLLPPQHTGVDEFMLVYSLYRRHQHALTVILSSFINGHFLSFKLMNHGDVFIVVTL